MLVPVVLKLLDKLLRRCGSTWSTALRALDAATNAEECLCFFDVDVVLSASWFFAASFVKNKQSVFKFLFMAKAFNR
jgi:hypothetical protein